MVLAPLGLAMTSMVQLSREGRLSALVNRLRGSLAGASLGEDDTVFSGDRVQQS
jgi:hypothetical protein